VFVSYLTWRRRLNVSINKASVFQRGMPSSEIDDIHNHRYWASLGLGLLNANGLDE
jgi:hypothetical protein